MPKKRTDQKMPIVGRTKPQFQRLLELDRRIREGKYPNCLLFSAEWEVSQKTVQRDIDYLRDMMGAPVEYDRQRKGFHYRDATWVLPSVVLSEGELLALLMGARAMGQFEGTPIAGTLRGLFGKLAQLLPDKITMRPEDLFTRFSVVGPPARPIDAQVWAAVVRGLMEQRVLEASYRPAWKAVLEQGKVSRLESLHLVNLQGDWYLLSRHAGHADVRQFALSRFGQVKVTEQRFAAPAFDAEKYLAGAFARYVGHGEAQEVRLLFRKDVAEEALDRSWHPSQKVTRRKSGEVEIRFNAAGLEEIQRWVLSWGAAVTVLAPKELRERVRNEAARMARGAR